MKLKYGDWAVLTPWLSKGWLQWEGAILVRILRPEVAHLTALGIKKVENMATGHWISYGVQGFIISVVKQGICPDSMEKYIPERYRSIKPDKNNAHKFTSIQIWSPPNR
jgi:hypothetical protein